MSDALDLREVVEREVARRWSEFEREHPRLAEELGREVYVAQAEERVREDPAYQEAMAQGRFIAGLAEVVGGIVERAVGAVLRV